MSHCCEMMREIVEKSCDQHSDRFDCPDCLVAFSSPGETYGLIIHDGGHSVIGISYCPWCGSHLRGNDDD